MAKKMGKLGVAWICLSVDTFKSEKIRLIESMPKGDSILVVWFRLLCLAGKKNQNGWLYLNKKTPYTIQMLVTLCNVTKEIMELSLKTFTDFGMIEMKENGLFKITKWAKYQNVDGLDKIREATRGRVRRFREKNKKEASRLLALQGALQEEAETIEKPKDTEDVTLPVTHSNAIEGEGEGEEEKEESKKTVAVQIRFDYKKGEFIGITPEYIFELQQKYPRVLIRGQLTKMANWLIDNPQKKRQGKRSFIDNWLSKVVPERSALRRLPQGGGKT